MGAAPPPALRGRRGPRKGERVEFLRVEPLELPLSRLALGTLGFSPATRDRDFAVLDAWVEAGGTVIDTAHVYEGGGAERVLGSWLRERPGVRERLVIVTKGAHPDGDHVRVTPADIASDLRDSVGAARRARRRLPAPPRRPGGRRRPADRRTRRAPARGRPARVRRLQLDAAADRGGERVRRRSRHRRLLLQQPAPVAGGAERAAVARLPVGDRRRVARLARPHGHAAARLVGAGGRLLRRVATGESARVYDNEGNRERRARAEQLGEASPPPPTRSRLHGCSPSRSRRSRSSDRTASSTCARACRRSRSSSARTRRAGSTSRTER